MTPHRSAPPCWVCGSPLDSELHTFHAEGCPCRDDLDHDIDGCVQLQGCGEDVHPECCPSCHPL